MKCVHGVEMAESCVNCWAQTAGTDMRIMSDFCVRKQPKTDDRIATELASLTRSIQGLSGNVAKLVESVAYKGAVGIDGKTCATATNIRAASSTGSVIGDGIKRGPVTHDEIQTAIEAADNYSYATRIGLEAMHCALETLAKSRGLID